MPLVEVVAGDSTAPEAAQKAAAFRAQDRQAAAAGEGRAGLPGQCRAGALHATKRCAASTKASHRRPSTRRCSAFGMPMGPIELADTVGLDVAVAAGKQLVGEAEPPRSLLELVDTGELGKKSGRASTPGVDGKAQKEAAPATRRFRDLPQRLAQAADRPATSIWSRAVSLPMPNWPMPG